MIFIFFIEKKNPWEEKREKIQEGKGKKKEQKEKRENIIFKNKKIKSKKQRKRKPENINEKAGKKKSYLNHQVSNNFSIDHQFSLGACQLLARPPKTLPTSRNLHHCRRQILISFLQDQNFHWNRWIWARVSPNLPRC